MRTLHPEVEAKYALVGIRPGKYAFKGFGEIDLCALSVAKADDLVRRGFIHLKLRHGISTGEPEKLPLKVRPITGNKGPVQEPVKTDIPENTRKNIQYVNKLLTMDWKDLSHQDRQVFFGEQAYFLEKKKILLDISAWDRDMKSLHAKVKQIKPIAANTSKIKEIMEKIASLDDLKAAAWTKIDTWEQPRELDPEQIAKEAIDREKLIKAHDNYIYRAEIALRGMPSETEIQKKRIAEKKAEVQRRKDELVSIGSPYDRKVRK